MKENLAKELLGNKPETVLIFGAHSDDFVIGAGGTALKYASEGKQVISIIFSCGENSHPWMKPEIIQKMRSREVIKAVDIMKCKVISYDLTDTKIYESYIEKKIEQNLLDLINQEYPTKIFTHSSEDPHPDHRAVNRITLELWDKLKKKPEVYIYSVWNPISFQTKFPSLYVDITKFFSGKLKALKAFRSQKLQIAYPFMLLIIRSIVEGFKIRKMFAERFFRIR